MRRNDEERKEAKKRTKEDYDGIRVELRRMACCKRPAGDDDDCTQKERND